MECPPGWQHVDLEQRGIGPSGKLHMEHQKASYSGDESLNNSLNTSTNQQCKYQIAARNSSVRQPGKVLGCSKSRSPEHGCCHHHCYRAKLRPEQIGGVEPESCQNWNGHLKLVVTNCSIGSWSLLKLTLG
ncbi:hypothetical protein Y1Q_0003894 [Alligator mississippiensis]|uniref:Uncharacterized protein n=1 Tax=Alligator mississippiensis TaxID=8496 RepID=A0A151MNZ3_ALLMI|nr:hypothetical protein Y1Q_0003894 [Alligator mississippiensis]